MAMICVRASAGDNLARFSHDDGEEATCRAQGGFSLYKVRIRGSKTSTVFQLFFNENFLTRNQK